MRLAIIALLLVASASASADTSYAYVTKVNGYRTAPQKHPHDRCSIVAQLPKATLAKQPASGDTSPLGSDAIAVVEDTDDDNDVCDRVLHTWLAVSFDASDRTKVHFDVPDPGWTISRVLVLIAIALGLGWFVRDRLRRRRAKADA